MDFPNPAGFIGSQGLSANVHGRACRDGCALSSSEKVTIGSAYLKARESNNNLRPNISALVRDCKVMRKTIMKVEGELVRAGRVIDPAVIARDKDMPSGSGTTCLKTRESNNNTQILRDTTIRQNEFSKNMHTSVMCQAGCFQDGCWKRWKIMCGTKA